MSPFLPLLIAFSAHAADPTLPSRPTTFVVAGPLTQGPVRNFRELFVAPEAVAAELKPVGVRKARVAPKVRPRVLLTREKFDISEKIFFGLNSAEIMPESFSLLDEVAQILSKHPEVLQVSIEGHTDSRGDDKANLKLSDQRASSVRAYLEGRGVAPDRLTSKGFGETRPLDTAENDAAWDQNRRVEFVVVSWDRAKMTAEAPASREAALEAAAEEVVEPGMPPTSALPIRNESSSYAEVTVNGVKIGVIGPLLNGSLEGVPTGFYDVTMKFQNGFSETRRVHTEVFDGAFIPGGEEARASLESGFVPTWAADPSRGYRPDENRGGKGERPGARRRK